MSADWLSLVPARLLELPAAGWTPAALGRARHLDGVVMVVDVCGFTAMSETVAQDGPGATERLSRTVNAVFSPIVGHVHRHGGEVALFVGDAVVALLPSGADALACAAAAHATASGLGLTIGLAAGRLTSTVVGDPGTRLEHVLIGDALARAAAAQGRAAPGETVGDVAADDGPRALRPVPTPPRDGRAAVAPFLHPSLAARLGAGRERLLAEHRRVTSLFCRFEALSDDDPAAPARLQAVVTAALAELTRFGGALLQVELVDKGSTLKATFGAPLAHEDDERRATACARALLARPELRSAAIGLSTGIVYCGLIGSPSRREYTVLGDAVNVAARLMLAARPGQILAAEATRVRAGDWGWEPAGRLALRGRAGSVAAYDPGADLRAPARRSGSPFVGRDRELRAAVHLLERALAGEGTLLTLTGEVGVGKSRLLDELVAVAQARGVTVLRGAGVPYGRDFAYGAWRDVGRELIADPAALGERATVLAPLLGLAPGETDLAPDLRAEALRDLVVEHLRSLPPLLLAFEDCQWLDEPSRELLERLAHELAGLPMLLVLTVRSDAGAPVAGGVTLAIEGLAPEAIARLVPGPPEVVDAVVARAGGNPLFAEELARFTEGRTVALPESLRSVVTARLDRLSERERAVVRIASAIGPRFASDWLSGSDPGVGGPAEVAATLEALGRLDIVHADGALHAFKHDVTREVAYDTLGLTAREHLHEAVARHLERSHDLAALETLELLAHHYSRSAHTGKQRLYLRRAGDAARAAFANDAAIRHYRDVLALPAGADALDVTLDLGAVLQLSGEWGQAEALYAGALANAESRHASARAAAALGGLLAFTGAYTDAIGRLEAARASFAALGDAAELARVLERLAHTCFEQGDNAAATAHAQEHARLARGLGDLAGESTAMNTLGLVLWHRGELEPAQARLEAALRLAGQAGHRVGVVHLLNDLAGLLVALGRPAEAIARLGEAQAQAREIGYRRFEGVIVANAAELFQLAGDDAPALACAGASLEIGASLGDVLQVLHNATVIAAVVRRQGDPRAAETLLARVVTVARASDHRRCVAEARLHQARARLDLQRRAEGIAAADEALAIARSIGQTTLAAEAEALLAGAPPPASPRGPALDPGPFLDASGASPAATVLVDRAARALAALNPSNDVVSPMALP